MAKVLILMSYFNRPKLVKNALNSILKSNQYHSDWELVFGDDGSVIPGRPIVEELLVDHLHKIRFIESGMSFQDKIEQGLKIGSMANQGIRDSSADLAVILCDDDELDPFYLKNISDFFHANPEVKYAYSLIHIYNPLFQSSGDITNLNHKYNTHCGPIDPVGKVDASQVAWRLSCCKEDGAWFQESTKFVNGKPWTKDTDKGFFENLRDKCGLCYPTGHVAQYKGIHDYQLLWHKNSGADQLKRYEEMCRNLGGVEF